MYYIYRNKLADIARKIVPATVNFHCEFETFNPQLHTTWHKGIRPNVTA